MTDPNMTDFYTRVARLEKARAKGYGFEAAGALGRSFYHKPTSRRRSVLLPLAFVMLCFFAMKGVVHHAIGAQVYQDRVATLAVGKGAESVGAWVMQADPLTVLISAQITKGLAALV
ncbi:MAG: hypothetical protein H7245_01950 [Candidatus Saccharibacteria bacterium]|nr:hypothetical protein [Pseudorhodobacter sp.]